LHFEFKFVKDIHYSNFLLKSRLFIQVTFWLMLNKVPISRKFPELQWYWSSSAYSQFQATLSL